MSRARQEQVVRTVNKVIILLKGDTRITFTMDGERIFNQVKDAFDRHSKGDSFTLNFNSWLEDLDRGKGYSLPIEIIFQVENIESMTLEYSETINFYPVEAAHDQP